MSDNKNNDYDKKNKKTDVVFILLTLYFVISFLVNVFIFLPLGQQVAEENEQEKIEQEIDTKETYDYYISFNKGNLNEHIKTNEYKIENGLIYVVEINYDGSTTNIVLNIDNYSIEYKNYIAPENFKPQFYVSYYNGSFNEYLYCDTIEYQEDNSILVTTKYKKEYIHGNYKIKELKEDEITKWLEEYAPEQLNQEIKEDTLTNDNKNDIL